MSGSPEDEAKARLEVAQLYEGMPGQAVKAARYYFAAAEIFRGAGLNTRAREIYQKVVQLEPSNTQAQTILQSLLQAAGGAAPAAAQPQAPQAPASSAPESPRPVSTPRPPGQPQQAAAGAVQPPRSIGLGATVPTSQPASSAGTAAAPPRGQVMIPTPWIGREPRYVAAARGQLTAPPDRKILPYDPLPPVDPNKVAARAEARKQAQKELNRKSATRIESAFGNSRSPFGKSDGDGGSGPAATGRFGGPPVAPTAPSAPKPAAAAEKPASRFGAPSGEMRGGNRDLADAIRRKLQGS